MHIPHVTPPGTSPSSFSRHSQNIFWIYIQGFHVEYFKLQCRLKIFPIVLEATIPILMSPWGSSEVQIYWWGPVSNVQTVVILLSLPIHLSVRACISLSTDCVTVGVRPHNCLCSACLSQPADANSSNASTPGAAAAPLGTYRAGSLGLGYFWKQHWSCWLQRAVCVCVWWGELPLL